MDKHLRDISNRIRLLEDELWRRELADIVLRLQALEARSLSQAAK